MAKLMDQSGSPPTQQVLKAWKLSILRILRSGLVFSPEQVLPLLIIASSDTQHEVVDSAEEAIKLLPQEREELESMALVKCLFSLFLGATASDGMSLRYRIVEQLCRSTLAMTLPAFCVKVIYECIFSPSSMSYPRLRVSGATFVIALASGVCPPHVPRRLWWI